MLRLSQQIIGVLESKTCNSKRREWIQKTSEAILVRVLYSTTVLKHETEACLCADQATGLAPRNTTIPEVDRPLSRSNP